MQTKTKRVLEGTWSGEQNQTAEILARKCFNLSWKLKSSISKIKWSASLKAKFNSCRENAFTFKTDWVFLFWDKLCLSGLLEDLSRFLILVSCRLDYGAAFGQQNTTSPLGTEAAYWWHAKKKKYLQAGKPDTVGDRKDEVLQWLRKGKKKFRLR